jgi:uncharacterized protein YggE
MKQGLASLLLSIACVTMLAPAAALAQETSDRRTIATNGEAVIYLAPNEAVVSVGVQTFDADLSASKATNDQESAKLLEAIKAMGIEDKHIQTAQLHIEIRYRDYGHPTQGIEGYTATKSYAVTLKDPSKAQQLIDVAMENGANMLLGVSFNNTELRKHRDEARKMAIKAAREKAELLAGELGMKVGKPFTIQEGYAGPIVPIARASTFNVVADRGGGESVDTIALGQIAIHANVSVVFDLEE